MIPAAAAAYSSTTWSQTPRAPMELSEFEGELFQAEAREPESDVTTQLPPNIAAFSIW